MTKEKAQCLFANVLLLPVCYQDESPGLHVPSGVLCGVEAVELWLSIQSLGLYQEEDE